MASSKVLATSTSTNSDLVRQSSTYSLSIGEDPTKFGSMSMDDLMRGFYENNNNPPSSDMIVSVGATTDLSPSSLSRQGSLSNKTADEVWKEISGSNSGNNNNNNGVELCDPDQKMVNEMTLEEFLTKAGAVREEDIKIPAMVGPVHGFVVDPALDTRYPQQQGEGNGGGGGGGGTGSGSGSILWLGNGGDRAGGGRGKRRAVLEPIDKVAQQRQRRMIKNRESAARSRERKQAYTVELETLVHQLEEENASLQREKVERNRERYKQLMEHLVPIDEKRRPLAPPVLRRSNSAHW